MTELFLKKDGGDWQQVYFATSGSGFKLTRENPYFTESESYTLDVSLPMDIIDNRLFFGNIQRIDTTKNSTKYQCRLMVGNKSMLDGTARVSQVTHDTVKVQLLGGNSELNFLESDSYIDEMQLGSYFFLGSFTDYKGNVSILDDNNIDIIAQLTTYDETNAQMVNVKVYHENTGKWNRVMGHGVGYGHAPQPKLLYILEAVLYLSGYTIQQCDIDCEPWNHLYVATAKATPHIAHVLPHWHVSEFLAEICKFFNCTLSIDSNSKRASIISNTHFFRNAKRVDIIPVEEYTSEMEDEEGNEVLAVSNIEFDMSSSSEHTYDCLSDSVREAIPKKYYSSWGDAHYDFIDFANPNREQRLQYMYICPTGAYIGWKADDNSDPLFSQIDLFSPLIRDKKHDNISLKICPVAMFLSDDALFYNSVANGKKMSCFVASIENPTGNEAATSDEEIISAQDLIEGDESLDKAENEDRLQLMFVDDVPQPSYVAGENKSAKLIMPFTDWNYLTNTLYPHRPWSMALHHTAATHYLGQLHNTDFSFNVKAKHTFKFLADEMPDPTDVFLIHGKLYGCEKIEANVTEEGFDKLMTGYFYEML